MSRTDASTGPDAAPTDPPPSGRRTLLLVAVVGLLLVGGVALVAGLRQQPAPAGGASDELARLDQADRTVGRPLPAASLPPLGDLGPSGGLELPARDGEPMVINFWATWCGPCVDEMPMLQRVADDLDLTVVGVDYVDQRAKAVDLATELDIRYALVRDDEGTFGQAVGLFGTPTTLLVDGDGVVRRRLTGELAEEELRAAVARDLG